MGRAAGRLAAGEAAGVSGDLRARGGNPLPSAAHLRQPRQARTTLLARGQPRRARLHLAARGAPPPLLWPWLQLSPILSLLLLRVLIVQGYEEPEGSSGSSTPCPQQ